MGVLEDCVVKIFANLESGSKSAVRYQWLIIIWGGDLRLFLANKGEGTQRWVLSCSNKGGQGGGLGQHKTWP